MGLSIWGVTFPQCRIPDCPDMNSVQRCAPESLGNGTWTNTCLDIPIQKFSSCKAFKTVALPLAGEYRCLVPLDDFARPGAIRQSIHALTEMYYDISGGSASNTAAILGIILSSISGIASVFWLTSSY